MKLKRCPICKEYLSQDDKELYCTTDECDYSEIIDRPLTWHLTRMNEESE